MPEEWEWPPELDAPTSFPEINLAIRILSCDYVGYRVLIALGRYISENASYMMWVAKVKGSGATAKDVAILGHIQLEQARRIYEAWRAFEELDRLDAPNEVVGERRSVAGDALAAVLTERCGHAGSS